MVFIEEKLSSARSQVELERARHLLCLSVCNESRARKRILESVIPKVSLFDNTACLSRKRCVVLAGNLTFLGRVLCRFRKSRYAQPISCLNKLHAGQLCLNKMTGRFLEGTVYVDTNTTTALHVSEEQDGSYDY